MQQVILRFDPIGNPQGDLVCALVHFLVAHASPTFFPITLPLRYFYLSCVVLYPIGCFSFSGSVRSSPSGWLWTSFCPLQLFLIWHNLAGAGGVTHRQNHTVSGALFSARQAPPCGDVRRHKGQWCLLRVTKSRFWRGHHSSLFSITRRWVVWREIGTGNVIFLLDREIC